MKINKGVVLLSLLLSTPSITTFAEDNERTIENRVDKLERLINNKGLVDIMVRVDSAQAELQRLLGEIELQKHTMEGLKKRQRDLYLDIDRRLLQIERRAGGGSSVSTSTRAIDKSKDIIKTTSATSNVDAVVKKIKVISPSDAGNSKSEQIAYQNAFDLLRALRYEKATQAFREFLGNHPQGRYAHIAQYWLAETSYHTRKYEVAVKDYQDLIDQYPKSPKRADALLKIGYSQFELKLFAKAKDVLQKLIQNHPGTTEAGQAENLLQKIRLQKIR